MSSNLATPLTTLALLLLLGIWVVLPWPGVVVLVAGVGVWLRFSRQGRLALAAAGVGISSLPQRWGAASVIVIGIAGVVAVLVAMLAMAAGFRSTLNASGSDDTAIVLRGGSQVEINSVVTREQAVLLANLDGVARSRDGRPLISAELAQVINLPTLADGTDANVQLRGVGPLAWSIRPNVRMVQGRRFQPGLREVIVGEGVAGQYRGVGIGDTLRLSNQEWTVVGRFASGDSMDSELWTDIETLSSFYRRSAYQSVTMKLQGAEALSRVQQALDADPRLKLDALSTREYFGKQASNMSTLIEVLGTVIGAIMAIGAVFGALNTMYAAIATRAREIATLRALGFRGLPVVAAVMLETMLLALLGGVIGCGLAWLVFNGYSVATMSANFSQVMFAFEVTPQVLWTGLKWALGIGLVGGLFPAMRAARIPVTEALRAL
ncbi:ABC transporter permease [Luteimonas sp. e5]